MRQKLVSFNCAFFFLVTGLFMMACSSSTESQEKSSELSDLKGIIMVELQTSKGNIKIELYPEKAPLTVKNFLNYAKSGFYDGTIFHRVIDGFMIQGGGFTPDMKQKPTKAPVKNESGNGLSNSAMTIAMARTADPDSATAQFFINLVDNDYLNGSANQPGYTVFGKVVDGENVVRQIGKVQTATRGFFENVPTESVLIQKVQVLKKTSSQ